MREDLRSLNRAKSLETASVQARRSTSLAKGSFAPLALGLVVLAGALCLPMPFWGDQALFTVYARQLTEGAVLYRDLFDVKQPGIFAFYAFGGLVFGFDEVGIHLFELLYWVGFSLFALAVLPPYFQSRWAPPLVPVFTVVVYYFYAGLLDLGQVEILVAFPILVAWWLIDRADPTTPQGRRRLAAAGLAAAAVVLLKHLYLLIVLAFLAYAALRPRRWPVFYVWLTRGVGAFLIGLVVPLLAVTAYFYTHGQLERIWWAYAEMAPAAQLLTPRPFSYLAAGARRFMIGHGPMLVLAALGGAVVLRHGIGRRFDLVTAMGLWLAAGVIAFPVVQGWPEYKWTLFTVPVGILAVVGCETLAETARGARVRVRARPLALAVALGALSFIAGSRDPQIQTRLLLAVAAGVTTAVVLGWRARAVSPRPTLWVLFGTLAVSTGLLAIAPAGKLRSLATHEFAVTSEARTRFQQSLNGAYRAADADLRVLRAGGADTASIYVFGDPVVLLRADRPQPLPILGWGPEFLDGRAWQELDRDLRSMPPCSIVIDRYPASIIRSRRPSIMEFIEGHYDVAFVGGSGTWYVRR